MSIENNGELIHKILFESNDREADMIKLTSSLSRAEREAIRQYYDASYPTTGLIKDLKKKLSGDFQDLMYRLFLTRPEYDAEQYIRSMGGITTDTPALYELLFSRPQWILDEAKQAYFYKAKKQLIDELPKAFSNPVKKVIPIFLNTQRRVEKNPNPELCEKYADLLINEKPSNWINNEQIMKEIFATLSPEELVLTCRYYLRTTGTTVSEAVKKLSNYTKEFFLSLLTYVICPAEMFAKRINESIRGLGTDTNLLERVVLNRHDQDFTLIKKYYNQLFKNTVKEDIEDDTSGSYRKMMVNLINTLSEEDA